MPNSNNNRFTMNMLTLVGDAAISGVLGWLTNATAMQLIILFFIIRIYRSVTRTPPL